MNNPHVSALAAALKEHVPDDARFLFAMVERDGNVHTVTSIQDRAARVEFLERVLARARKEWGNGP